MAQPMFRFSGVRLGIRTLLILSTLSNFVLLGVRLGIRYSIFRESLCNCFDSMGSGFKIISLIRHFYYVQISDSRVLALESDIEYFLRAYAIFHMC